MLPGAKPGMARSTLRIHAVNQRIAHLRLLPTVAEFAQLRGAKRRVVARIEHQNHVLPPECGELHCVAGIIPRFEVGRG